MTPICTGCNQPIKRGQTKITDMDGHAWHLVCKKKDLKRK